MQQLPMAYDDSTPWTRLRGIVENAVNHLGQKEVTFKLNIAKSTLTDALRDRNDRGLRLEWTLAVLELLRDQYTEIANQHMLAILDALAVVTRRFEVVAINDGPSDAEIEAAERVIAEAKKRKARGR
jgi:hypothetical protein